MGNEAEQIKQRLDIVEIVKEYVTLKQAGNNHKGVCPFHQEKSASFMVSQSKQIWHCFGCHKGGDLFSFIEEIEGIEFYDALKLLANRAGIIIEKADPKKVDQQRVLSEIVATSAQFFHKLLLDHPKAAGARQYLIERGVNSETTKQFQLGFAPDEWEVLAKFLKQRGYLQKDILAAGMLVANKEKGSVYDRFRNRLMIPLQDGHGKVVGFTARALEKDFQGGKYINSPQSTLYDKSRIVFGLHLAKKAIKEAGQVVVVEGNMDVIASHQAGVKNVVAVSGTALTDQQLALLKRFTTTLVFAFDADSAGLAAMRRGVELALTNNFDVRVLTLPAGNDPDECIQKGVHLWKDAIAKAQPVIDFVLALSLQQHQAYTAQGKKNIATDVLSLLRYVTNAVEIDHYLQLLSRELGVSVGGLREQLGQPVRQSNQQPPAPHIGPPPMSATQEAGWGALSLLFQEPQLILDLGLEPGMLSGDQEQALYKKFKIDYSNDTNEGTTPFDLQAFIIKLSDDLKTLVTHIQLYGDKEFAQLDSREKRDALQARILYLKRTFFTQQLQQVQQALKIAESRNDREAITQLSQQFSIISSQMLDLS